MTSRLEGDPNLRKPDSNQSLLRMQMLRVTAEVQPARLDPSRYASRERYLEESVTGAHEQPDPPCWPVPGLSDGW